MEMSKKLTANGEIFPEEIMLEILSRVPPKSLVRFKVVSKHWHGVISSNFFILEKHMEEMRKQGKYTFLLQEEFGFHALVYEKQSNGVVSRVLNDFDAKYETLANCSGIVCFCNQEDEFVLGNPVSMSGLKIPSFDIDFHPQSKWCYVIFGLGYDTNLCEYMLLRLCLFNNIDAKISVSIFYSNSRTWKHLSHFPYETPSQQPGVFVNGKLHWQIRHLGHHYGICCFDVSTEQYELICIPLEETFLGRDYCLGSLDDKTLVLYSSFCKKDEGFVLWIHENNTWNKLIVNLEGLDVPNNRLLSFTPFCMRDCDREWILIRLEPDGTLFMYHRSQDYSFRFVTSVLPNGYGTIFRCLNTLENPAGYPHPPKYSVLL